MPIVANGDYAFSSRDKREAFHGAMLVYAGWDRHLMFASPYAFALPPDMPFAAFVEGPLGQAFGAHPDWAEVDWSAARWTRNGEPFVPDMNAGLEANGITHKDSLRFDTPGLDGIGGRGI